MKVREGGFVQTVQQRVGETFEFMRWKRALFSNRYIKDVATLMMKDGVSNEKWWGIGNEE